MTVEHKRALLRLLCDGRSCVHCILKENVYGCSYNPYNSEEIEKAFKKFYDTSINLKESVKELGLEEVEQTEMPFETISTDENEITLRVGKNANVDCVIVYFNKKEESEEE